jgi:hypothetical protein
METRAILLSFVILIAAAEFFVSNHALKGYLRDDEYLAREIKTPVDSLAEYRIANEAPFKYRIVFSSIVKSTHHLFFQQGDSDGFFQVYRAWSLVFFVTSACAFFGLLVSCGFSPGLSFAGTLIYLALPPSIMAYTLPVHTREDTLAYTLFFSGITFLIRQQRRQFALVSILGAMTRETLLLLPLLYLIFGKDEKISRKISILVISLAVWIGIRLGADGEPYDVWLGLRWNMNNPEQVIGFTFITFNFLWLTYLLHYLIYKRNLHYISGDLRFFYKSSIFVLVVILVTTFFGGIFNEVRLLNLFSPWMIIFFLDCFRHNREHFKFVAGTKYYWLFAAGSLLGCAIMLYFALSHRDELIIPGKFAVPYDQWIIFSVCYIFVFMLLIPHLLRIFSLKNPAK